MCHCQSIKKATVKVEKRYSNQNAFPRIFFCRKIDMSRLYVIGYCNATIDNYQRSRSAGGPLYMREIGTLKIGSHIMNSHINDLGLP